MPDPLNEQTAQRLSRASVPSVVSTLYRMGFHNTFLRTVKRLNRDATMMVGVASTLRTIPIREDLRQGLADGTLPNLQMQLVEDVQAGAVLICAAGGETGTAFMGDMIATALGVRGVGGVIIDGAVNDRAAIAGLPLPVYASGDASLPFASHRYATDIDVPVECDGVAVFPGDVVVGDANGVAIIPRAVADEVSAIALEKEQLEAFAAGLLRDGAPLKGTYPPDEATRRKFEAWRADRDG